MKNERWKEIEKVYHSALKIDPNLRESFLTEACGGDETIRKELQRLLEGQAGAEDFIESPAIGVVARALAGECEDELSADSAASDKRESADPQVIGDSETGQRRRAPWWMYVLAVIFLITIVIRLYAFYIQPQSPGITFAEIKEKSGRVRGVMLRTVLPDSPAEKAGLLPGDLVLATESGDFISSESGTTALYWRAGRIYRLEIVRKGENKSASLTLVREDFGKWLTQNLSLILGVVLGFPLAVLIAFKQPDDLRARWGALFLANAAVFFLYIMPPLGLYSAVSHFPLLIGWPALFLASLCRQLAPPIQVTFLAIFPRTLFHRRSVWALMWLPYVIFMPYFYSTLFSYRLPRLYASQATAIWPVFLVQIFGFAAECASGVILIANWRGLRDPNDRRRMRILVLGIAVAVVSSFPQIAGITLGRLPVVRSLLNGIPVSILTTLKFLYLAIPISMAYAILRHRLFDIRVMVRLGLRYAVARGALLALVPVVAVVLVSDMLFHGNQPLIQILRQRGLLYAVLACGGFLLHIRRRVWLDALDRRFFREQYNAQLVLRAVVEEVRETRDFQAMAPRAVSQIETALHPQSAMILVRRPGDLEYDILAAGGEPSPSISADSKLMKLVRVLGEPVEISQSRTGWLWNQLPQREKRFLRRARLEWLFPICLAEGRTEALLAMGPKRSEEPYSREDQELLRAITSSLGLLLDRTPKSTVTREGFEECPECGTCYDSGSGSCRNEGAKLTPVFYPRILNHRYRFQQRLGQGGMGVVYEAHDAALDRRVAVKLMRPDLMTSLEAAARFRREAKAAASFTHPNVVTVHDFGFEDNQRAYLVMELLRGSTLRQELHRHGRLDVKHTSEILEGIYSAVDAAHQQRLLHRDLKPENIFLVNSGGVEVAKILDFGVVKPMAPANTSEINNRTGSGMLLGTLKYMSPEQLRGEDPAESWDLWALAVVVYEMLTAAHPFAGSTALEIRDAVLAGRVTPLQAHLPEAPSRWQQFFDAALALDVRLRPTSALQLFSNFTSAIGPSFNRNSG